MCSSDLVPACLACNGEKGDAEAFDWYRQQRFYDPRRAMALRAWTEGDLKLALRLLEWAMPLPSDPRNDKQSDRRMRRHQTRQATAPAWRWQMAA